jgi:hypothetical protein
MKSGTTYLSGLLGRHPAIYMSSPKEPCRFVDPKVLRKEWAWAYEQGNCRSEDRYLSLFSAAGGATILGEASTVYSQVPLYTGVPQRILAFNPNARFIYIMRDPVERAISHYWHRVRDWGERRDMLSAIRDDAHYRDVSHYARQLKIYLQHVGPERIYTLTHEELVADPLERLSCLYAWLGVDPSFRPARIGIPENEMPSVIEQVRDPGLLDRVRHSAMFRGVAPYLPLALRKLGAAMVPTHRVKPADVDTSEVRAFLRAECQPQIAELSLLLQRKFPMWTSGRAADRVAPPAIDGGRRPRSVARG